MTGTRAPSPWLVAAVGLMLLTVGLAGCMTSDSPSTQPRSDCAKRGSGAPRTITSQYLTQDERWTPDPSKRVDIQLKGSNFLALNNHTLTVEPCTIVEVVDGGGIVATREASTLKVLGDANKEAHFRSAQGTPGSWVGIRLHMSSTDRHVVSNATIDDAGAPGSIGTPAGGLQVLELGPGDRLTVDNTTIRKSMNAGLYLGAEPGFDQSFEPRNIVFQNNTYTDNEQHGVETSPILAEQLDEESRFRGNDESGVHVLTNAQLEGKHVWDDLGAPYTIHDPTGRQNPTYNGGLHLRGRLEVEAGTTVEFEQGSQGLTVLGGEGHGDKPGLVALGGVEQPVTFTGETKIAGSWGYIRIVGGQTDNAFYSTDIAFGGGLTASSGGHGAGTNLYLDSPDYAVTSNVQFPGYKVKVFNSQLSLSGGDGLHVADPSAIDLDLDHVDFVANDGHPIAAHPSNLEDLETTFVHGSGSLAGPGELTFIGNQEDTVIVTHDDLPGGDVTIPALNIPYEPKFGLTKDTAGTLTLPAGTQMQFPRDEAFTVERERASGGYATLTAQGTPADPVVLEGTKAQAGHWRGLYFQTGSKANLLEYTEIRHGGSSDWQSETCAGQPQLDTSNAPGGNLIVGDDCSSKPNGKVTWLSGSSTQHPSSMAGIWANECDEIKLETSGAPQVWYTSFDTADHAAGTVTCPPQTN